MGRTSELYSGVKKLHRISALSIVVDSYHFFWIIVGVWGLMDFPVASLAINLMIISLWERGTSKMLCYVPMQDVTKQHQDYQGTALVTSGQEI